MNTCYIKWVKYESKFYSWYLMIYCYLWSLSYCRYWHYHILIFLTRMSKYNKVEVLEKAEKDLAAVTDQYMSRLVRELQRTDFWKLRRAYSPGVYTSRYFLVWDQIHFSDACCGCLQIQEYVEAATFCSFCKNGTLLKLDEINNTLLPLSDPSLQPLQINILDYLLGVNFFPLLLLSKWFIYLVDY